MGYILSKRLNILASILYQLLPGGCPGPVPFKIEPNTGEEIENRRGQREVRHSFALGFFFLHTHTTTYNVIMTSSAPCSGVGIRF